VAVSARASIERAWHSSQYQARMPAERPARTFFLPLLLLAAAKAFASFDFCSLGACTRKPGQLSSMAYARGTVAQGSDGGAPWLLLKERLAEVDKIILSRVAPRAAAARLLCESCQAPRPFVTLPRLVLVVRHAQRRRAASAAPPLIRLLPDSPFQSLEP
jgi:hypothetical protein